MALLAATCSKIGPGQTVAAAPQSEGGGHIMVGTGGQQIIVSQPGENWVQLGGGATSGTAVQVPVVDSSGKQQSTIALNPQLLQQTPQVGGILSENIYLVCITNYNKCNICYRLSVQQEPSTC